MIYHPILQFYTEQYQQMDCSQSLEIVVEFASSPAGYDLPHLDNILAKAVVNEATQGKGLPRSAEPYWLPVPLFLIWQRPENNLPLWASTDFFPIDEDEIESAYWHKKTIRPTFMKRKKDKPVNIRGTEGQDKEYQIPLPRHTANVFRAICQGNIKEITRLLGSMSAIGKKHTQGHGTVLQYQIQEISGFSFFDDNGMLLRPVPYGYFERPSNGVLLGWTPPYWLPTCQMLCVAPGTKI